MAAPSAQAAAGNSLLQDSHPGHAPFSDFFPNKHHITDIEFTHNDAVAMLAFLPGAVGITQELAPAFDVILAAAMDVFFIAVGGFKVQHHVGIAPAAVKHQIRLTQMGDEGVRERDGAERPFRTEPPGVFTLKKADKTPHRTNNPPPDLVLCPTAIERSASDVIALAVLPEVGAELLVERCEGVVSVEF